MTSTRALGLAVAALSSCGDGRDDPGSGTGTLTVVAQGVIADRFTDVTVEIRARGLAVTDAVVTLTDLERRVPVSASARGPGIYQGRLEGGPAWIGLDVRAGEDGLDARLDGPGRFEVTRPPAGALVRAGDASRLLVAWGQGEDAEEAVLAVLDASDRPAVAPVSVAPDPGEARVDLPTEPGRYLIVVRRRRLLALAGGAPGATFRLERAARAEFELAR